MFHNLDGFEQCPLIFSWVLMPLSWWHRACNARSPNLIYTEWFILSFAVCNKSLQFHLTGHSSSAWCKRIGKDLKFSPAFYFIDAFRVISEMRELIGHTRGPIVNIDGWSVFSLSKAIFLLVPAESTSLRLNRDRLLSHQVKHSPLREMNKSWSRKNWFSFFPITPVARLIIPHAQAQSRFLSKIIPYITLRKRHKYRKISTFHIFPQLSDIGFEIDYLIPASITVLNFKIFLNNHPNRGTYV